MKKNGFFYILSMFLILLVIFNLMNGRVIHNQNIILITNILIVLTGLSFLAYFLFGKKKL